MIIKDSRLQEFSNEKYNYKRVEPKKWDEKTQSFIPIMTPYGITLRVLGVAEIEPRKEYNQNCIVRKISRNEYAYA